MYIPPKFRIDDPVLIHSFIRENSFGLLLSHEAGEIHDTHTPFIIGDNGKLLGHIAKANPQWKGWANLTRVKIIFTGPHCYISPNFYKSDFNVPTWNYSAVSVTGTITVIEDDASVLNFLDRLVQQNEAPDSGWKLNREEERYMKLLSSIVVFSVSMDRVEASFKLNQNKSAEDQASVASSLLSSGCPFDKAISSMMSANLNAGSGSEGKS